MHGQQLDECQAEVQAGLHGLVGLSDFISLFFVSLFKNLFSLVVFNTHTQILTKTDTHVCIHIHTNTHKHA